MKIEFPCSEYIGQLEVVKTKQSELNREIGNFSAAKENFSAQEKSGILKNIYDIRKELKGSLTEIMMELAADYIGHENFFGLKEISSALGIEVALDKVPPIPFNKEDLEQARQLDQFLVLRINKANDGEPLTIKKITAIKDNKFADGAVLLNPDDESKNLGEEFFINEAPRCSWALVTREVIEGTLSENFLEQIEPLVQYLEEEIFFGKELPQPYLDAVRQYRENESLLKKNWRDWSNEDKIFMVNGLKITNLLRRRAVEIVYDSLLVSDGKFGPEKLLGSIYDTSFSIGKSISSAVIVGNFIGAGFKIHQYTLTSGASDVGVCLSRSF